MSVIRNGETWYYVDTTYDEDMVYDIYENDKGEVFYQVVDTLY